MSLDNGLAETPEYILGELKNNAYIAVYPWRSQPYTVHYKGFILGFERTADGASARIEAEVQRERELTLGVET